MENEGVDIFLEDILHVSRLQLSQSKLFEFFLVFWILGTNLVFETDIIWVHVQSHHVEAELCWFSYYLLYLTPICRHQLDPIGHLCVIFLASSSFKAQKELPQQGHLKAAEENNL